MISQSPMIYNKYFIKFKIISNVCVPNKKQMYKN